MYVYVHAHIMYIYTYIIIMMYMPVIIIILYCMAGKFGMEFNLVVWRILVKPPNFIPHIA